MEITYRESTSENSSIQQKYMAKCVVSPFFCVHQMVEKEKSVAEQSTVSLDSRGRHRSMAKIRPATALGCPKKNYSSTVAVEKMRGKKIFLARYDFVHFCSSSSWKNNINQPVNPHKCTTLRFHTNFTHSFQRDLSSVQMTRRVVISDNFLPTRPLTRKLC